MSHTVSTQRRWPRVLAVTITVLALVAGFVGLQLYRKLTSNTVVAYFTATNALYAGDIVQIMGVPVGSIDKIEPAGDQMKVTFHYANKYKVPEDASAVILNPTLVASRVIQLAPAYTGGPTLGDGAVIPVERTQVPVEWDDLRKEVTNLVEELGPQEGKPDDMGPVGDVIDSLADGLAGKGQQINKTLTNLSTALTALNEGRGDFFAVVRSLALFVNALHQSDQQFVALNNNLAQFTTNLSNSDRELADAIEQVDRLLPTLRGFLDENTEVLTHDVQNLYNVTTTLVQPEPLDGFETSLHVYPSLQGNLNGIYHPVNGAIVQVPVVTNFANPMAFICSAIQAGSRLGYQESAELCAQYLGPILDAMKFNFPPFGMNLFSSAATLPKMVAYSEERLRPPPGYKDTTVPGIFSPDTIWSHRNSEPGWIVAPGMQGVEVQGYTANLLTPESLAELMGGPNIEPPTGGQTMTGPPNAYDQHNPLPPPWYPQPGPLPAPGPEVTPGMPPAQVQVPSPMTGIDPGDGVQRGPLPGETP
ncbi:mammalian cell entry protein [Mycolicibacillus trivialis]|uniref:Mammalian cell entry protein n=1 Tax=Mycolicibacillus trivialis TaxID=1798 RepID=A0A1X2EFB6_9MYCO|nr:mammalian cell entry protein [Mycolicibacillus trivialis]